MVTAVKARDANENDIDGVVDDDDDNRDLWTSVGVV